MAGGVARSGLLCSTMFYKINTDFTVYHSLVDYLQIVLPSCLIALIFISSDVAVATLSMMVRMSEVRAWLEVSFKPP